MQLEDANYMIIVKEKRLKILRNQAIQTKQYSLK